jgi:hypothetical protein
MASEQNSSNSVCKECDVEVEEETRGYPAKAHVGHQLRDSIGKSFSTLLISTITELSMSLEDPDPDDDAPLWPHR